MAKVELIHDQTLYGMHPIQNILHNSTCCIFTTNHAFSGFFKTEWEVRLSETLQVHDAVTPRLEAHSQPPDAVLNMGAGDLAARDSIFGPPLNRASNSKLPLRSRLTGEAAVRRHQSGRRIDRGLPSPDPLQRSEEYPAA